MNKVIVILGIILLLGFGFSIYYYFEYEKPKQELYGFYNLSVSAWEIDENGNQVKRIQTYVNIVLDDSKELYQKIKTEEQGYVLVNIPNNHSATFFNENLDNQSYYTIRYRGVGTNRVDIGLLNIGKLNITQEGIFGKDKNIKLILTSNSDFRFINYCVVWSPNIIKVESYDISKGVVPIRLKGKVDKCHVLYKSILNSNDKIEIPLEYELWGDNIENEFIKVYILDGDIRYWSMSEEHTGMYSYIIEENEKDIGAQDIEYFVK